MSKSGKHPTLSLDISDMSAVDFREIFLKRIKLPEKILPKSFWMRDDNFFVGGYYLLFEDEKNERDIFAICKQKRWEKLINLRGDFWLLCADFYMREIYVITDSVSKFSTFFSVSDGKLMLSTSFGEVVENLPVRRLNLGAALDFITNFRFLAMDENTVIENIYQLPPGTYLKIDKTLSWSIKSLVDVDSMFVSPSTKYESPEELANDFLKVLDFSVQDRLKQVSKYQLAGDISSGFDSSLICYCLSKLIPNKFKTYCWKAGAIDKRDTDPEVVRQFAEKHKFEVDFFDVSEMYSFSEFDINWTQSNLYPGNHAAEVLYKYCLEVSGGHPTALFQGHGGDEVYGSASLEMELRFAIQSAYFLMSKNLKLGADELLFTPLGRDEFFAEERFVNRGYFPPSVSVSTGYLFPAMFGLYWEADVWPLHPYTDPRLIQLARSISSKGNLASIKREFWKQRKDIFVDKQFEPGWHMGGLFSQFVWKRKEVVLSILENSVLSEAGYVKGKEIVKNLKAGKADLYTKDGVAVFFDSLLHLELFIQKNKVVP